MIERDPIERQMGKDVEEMTSADLVTYMRTYLKAVGVDLPISGPQERATIESFRKRYPKGRAGRIIQHAMLRRGGRKDGKWITPAFFSKAMKWWTDDLWLEAQEEDEREREWSQDKTEVESGWLDASTFLGGGQK